jgi:hypothetical protein
MSIGTLRAIASVAICTAVAAFALVGCQRGSAEASGTRPLLVSANPDAGSEVAPGATSISFTFDRPMMDQSWSLVRDGEHPYPQISNLRYSGDLKTLTVDVVLAPSTNYQFWLNHSRFRGFRSANNVPLDPVRYQISTKAS